MQHEEVHERLALRLYGELETDEARALDAHLASCAACRCFAQELEHGLGRVVRARASAPRELPSDWSERLRAATRAEPRSVARTSPSLISPWWSAAAGLAAGLLLALLALRAEDGGSTRSARDDRSAYARYYGSATPPAATSGGQWSRLAAQRRR